MADSQKTGKIKMETVKLHNKPDDLWVVIEGKVYNCSKFRREHPGGEEVLDEMAGTDATEAFNDVGHSAEARQMLKDLYVGDLEVEAKLPGMKKVFIGIGGIALGIAVVFLIRRAMK